MQRLIAIVLPEPVAILNARRWRFGSPGWIDMPVLGELEQVRERADPLDLGQVDERLDRLALAEVEAERAARRRCGARRRTRTPSSRSRGVARARVALRAPGVDRARERR